jgi:hypothetical protein
MKKINFLSFSSKWFQVGMLALLTVFGTNIAVGQYYITYSEGVGSDFAPVQNVSNEVLGGSIGSFNEQMSALQTIPFNFSFYGSPVTNYRISDNGYITFDVTQTTSNSQNNSYTLPDAMAPTNAIFGYWDDHELNTSGGGATDVIHTYTVGDVGKRVHVIAWYSVSRVGQTSTDFFSYFAIRLYENHDYDFDIIYQYGRTTTAMTYSATIGCQNANGTAATTFTGSPNIEFDTFQGAGGTPPPLSTTKIYAFRTGTQPTDDAFLTGFYMPIEVKQNGFADVSGSLFNHGSAPISNITITYTNNGSNPQNFSPTLAQPIQPNEKYDFIHSVPFQATNLGLNEIELFVTAINTGTDGNPDTLTEDPFVNQGLVGTRKQVLMEEFSTAPCQFCPDAAVLVEQFEQQYGNQLIVVQHHAGFSTDAMTIPEHSEYASGLSGGSSFAPAASIDRWVPPGESTPYLSRSNNGWSTPVANRVFAPAAVDMNVETYFNFGSRQLQADVEMDFADAVRPDARLTVFLVEDTVIGSGSGYDQVNAYNGSAGHPYFGAGNPIVGYPHRYVVREVLSGTWGDLIDPSSVGSQQTKTYNFTVPVTYDYEQLRVVAFLSNYVQDPDESGVNLEEIYVINSDASEVAVRGVGIEDDLVADGFSAWIAPNPTNGMTRVHFEMNTQTNLKVEVVDLMGRTIQQVAQEKFFAGEHELNFDVSEMSNGVYFVRFQSEQGVHTQRFMVAK